MLLPAESLHQKLVVPVSLSPSVNLSLNVCPWAGETSDTGLDGGYSPHEPPAQAAQEQLGTWRRKSPQLFLSQLFITNKANSRSGFSGTVNEQNAALLGLSRITFRFQFVKVVIAITAAIIQPLEEVQCSLLRTGCGM